MKALYSYMEKQADLIRSQDLIKNELFTKYNVKRGLRDVNGDGVLAGLTHISCIKSKEIIDGKAVPCRGKLTYRGYDIHDLVRGIIADERPGFEETAYLLLFGELPDKIQLKEFSEMLSTMRCLPTNFVRDVVMKAPSRDIMNSMTKSVLTLASYDPHVSDLSMENVLRQCMMLISVFPMLAVYGYHAYNHYEQNESMYIHHPDPQLSTAENLLRLLRPDMKYTKLEAKVLDIALMLHMEHGGGNNSTFTTRVVTSSGSDTYAVMAAALSSLKGPKHGGANIKVVEMMSNLKQSVSDYSDEDQITDYLQRVLKGQAFDGRGLIYGMGHAVYSISDPRAEVFKSFVEKLAKAKGRMDEFELYSNVEKLAPQVIGKNRKMYKGVSANVDFYSGFVYSMLEIPLELYTPIFAIARIVGWSAHRIEELVNADKIIRPAYKSLSEDRTYISLENRDGDHQIQGQDYKDFKLEEKKNM
ncbi:MAG TPA: citrate/2-methylcitrate synthase [Candidatus Eubacterium avistercoris]|uniref:Citrate synthase n=1 Tax=Candidatus Eubacterium avistercoris TaxID=2838567 RepID=A0A9D2D433_9FIRM|nr:citrate/2-methylcitrate synthase [Candidatus Eubacterium avistercoris]